MSRLLKNANFPKLNPQLRTIKQTRNFLTKKCPPKPEEQTKCGASAAASGSDGGGEIPIGYQLLKNTQAKFQRKDGRPVWLKGGPMDRILYLSTVGLSIVGLGCSLVFISKMILK